MEKEKTYPGQTGMLKLSIVMYIGMAVHSSLLVYKGFVLFTFDCTYCMPWGNLPCVCITLTCTQLKKIKIMECLERDFPDSG